MSFRNARSSDGKAAGAAYNWIGPNADPLSSGTEKRHARRKCRPLWTRLIKPGLARCFISLDLAMRSGRRVVVLYRTDGSGKADLNPAKLMLGATSGGAVKLTVGQGPLVVAEGIETALSLASGVLRDPATIWAALSTSGMRELNLPAVPGHLIVASDGDSAGWEAAQALATRASALGWQVSLLPAPDDQDWSDVLMMKGPVA